MHLVRRLLVVVCFVAALGGVIQVEHEQAKTYVQETCLDSQTDRAQLNKRVFYLNTIKTAVVEEATTETQRDKHEHLKPRKSVSILGHTNFERLPEISC